MFGSRGNVWGRLLRAGGAAQVLLGSAARGLELKLGDFGLAVLEKKWEAEEGVCDPSPPGGMRQKKFVWMLACLHPYVCVCVIFVCTAGGRRISLPCVGTCCWLIITEASQNN